MHFRILKMIASSGFLECSRVHQIRFSPRIPLGELTAPPHSLAGLRDLLLRERAEGTGKKWRGQMGRGRRGRMEGKGEGCQGKGRKGEKKGGEGGKGKEWEGGEGRKVRTPLPSIPAHAPVSRSTDVIIHD